MCYELVDGQRSYSEEDVTKVEEGDDGNEAAEIALVKTVLIEQSIFF